MNKTLKERIRRVLPNAIKPHTILRGFLRGSTIVTSWHDYPGAILGSTEWPLLEWFAKNVREGETWLDIGAHYGYTAVALSKLVGPSGRVFAFEPMLATAGCVSRTRIVNRLEQLIVIPIGLTNCADLGTERLQTVRGMIDGTLNGHAGFEMPFMVSRLDWLWPRIAGSDLHIDGVKIDVQGMEIHVLEGMTELLRKNRPKLVVEVHKGVSRPRLLELLSSSGYLSDGSAVEPVPSETSPLYADDRSYAFTAKSF
jgi:FkbM family methyltransferase